MLDVLGLGDDEESAYRVLVAVRSADATELARRLRTGKGEAAHALAALERLGLAARSSESSQRYVASPPSVALAALMVRRQEELRRAEVEIADLTETYRSTESDRTVSDVVDVVHGEQAVAQRFLQLQAAAQDEVLGLVKARVAVVAGEDNTAEEDAVERGVRFQVVVEQDALEQPGFFAAAEDALAAGEDVRVAPEVPIRLLIVDRTIALVPLVSRDQQAVGALLVHEGGLLDALIALYDHVWDASVPLVLGDSIGEQQSEGLDRTDGRILGLLLAGLTDQAVSSQLGLSQRTVQRRVRTLMDEVGAQTRLQLGYHAAKRGWVLMTARSERSGNRS